MPSRRPAVVLAALSLPTALIAPSVAQSAEFQCRRGDLVRRIEVQFADDADRLPCQVVYWRDTEQPGRPRVPWNAENQLEFCVEKAREMVDSLQSAGWTCDGDSLLSQDAAETNAEPATARPSRARAAADAPTPSPPRDPANGSPPSDHASLEAALARDLRRVFGAPYRHGVNRPARRVT